jgi:uncharacterized protein (DUF302 family)
MVGARTPRRTIASVNTSQSTLAAALTALVLLGACASADPQKPVPVEPIAYHAELSAGFDESIDRVTAALAEAGFSVVTRLDLHDIFRQKLGADMAPHTILGACNSKLAHKAVTAMPEASLMLPCNVTVQQLEEGRVMVRIVNAEAMMAGAGLDANPAVHEVGEKAHLLLKGVAEGLNDPQ